MCKFSYFILAIFQYGVFYKEAKIWNVQNYSSDKGLTQLRNDYIFNFTKFN